MSRLSAVTVLAAALTLVSCEVPLRRTEAAELKKTKASFYWRGQSVACGGRFNPEGLTAAHRTLPCGTKVEVTNTRNGKSVVVTINDKGPFVRGRDIDVSRGAARVLGMTRAGVVPVTYRVVSRRSGGPVLAAEPDLTTFKSRFLGCNVHTDETCR